MELTISIENGNEMKAFINNEIHSTIYCYIFMIHEWEYSYLWLFSCWSVRMAVSINNEKGSRSNQQKKRIFRKAHTKYKRIIEDRKEKVFIPNNGVELSSLNPIFHISCVINQINTRRWKSYHACHHQEYSLNFQIYICRITCWLSVRLSMYTNIFTDWKFFTSLITFIRFIMLQLPFKHSCKLFLYFFTL